jgi:hypothetical protein
LNISKDDAVEIHQVGNGFLVRRPYNIAHGTALMPADMLVFRTMAELQNFLGEHFTHRARPNWPDIMPVADKKPAKAA